MQELVETVSLNFILRKSGLITKKLHRR